MATKRTTTRTPKKRTLARKTPAPPPTTGRTVRRSAKPAAGTRRAPSSIQNGCVLTACVVERQGRVIDRAEATVVATGKGVRSRRNGGATTETARRLAAVGHPKRLTILALLLEGPAVYRALQRATGLSAGPLYHHVNQLRLAGLILPKQRDVYELTRGGRNIILLAMALDRLGGDSRPRPLTRD